MAKHLDTDQAVCVDLLSEHKKRIDTLENPTEEMLVAASVAIMEIFRGGGGWCGKDAAREMYIRAHKAALKAQEDKTT